MKADDYQKATRATVAYEDGGLGTVKALAYVGLGLAGESGEVVECIKKLWRNGESADLREKAKKELGDVLWYAARIADELGVTLSDVMASNVAKCADRQARNVIKSAGDER